MMPWLGERKGPRMGGLEPPQGPGAATWGWSLSHPHCFREPEQGLLCVATPGLAHSSSGSPGPAPGAFVSKSLCRSSW